MRFEIDIETPNVIIAFRKYNSIKHEPNQSIIIWWLYGSAVFKIIKDYDKIDCYFFETSKRNMLRLSKAYKTHKKEVL